MGGFIVIGYVFEGQNLHSGQIALKPDSMIKIKGKTGKTGEMPKKIY